MLTPHCRSQPAWDYRIKAFPWRLFEIVTIRFQPATIMVQDVWAATMLNNVIEGHGEDTWRVVTVELAHKSQDDFTFAISGTQGPPKRTALSCANDQAPPNTCALEPAFSVLNNYNGIISPRVFVQSWQIGAEIDLAFDARLSVGEAWGAEVIDDDVPPEPGQPRGKGQTVRFRLLPIARGLPPERKSSFGFEASPPFHAIPAITCTLKHSLPPPPPPSPPSPSPPPPQRALIDRGDCFLGGRMHFTKPPSGIGMPWRLDLIVDMWAADILITLDFKGDAAELRAHPLQIEEVQPKEALWQDAITAHSVTYRTRPVEGNAMNTPIHVIAYGQITGLGRVSCCCAPPPPPPPGPPPSLSPKPPPHPYPRHPPPPPYSTLGDLEIGGNEALALHAPPPSAPAKRNIGSWTGLVWLGVVAFVGLVAFGQRIWEGVKKRRVFWRMEAAIAEVVATRAPGAHIVPSGLAGGDLEELKAEEDRESAVHARPELTWGGEKDGGKKRKKKGKRRALADADAENGEHGANGGAGALLRIELPDGSVSESTVELGDLASMKALQSLVVREWAAAGGDRREAMMVQFADEADGELAKVTRSTTIDEIRAAAELCVQPKARR